jgi:hypothetical protein
MNKHIKPHWTFATPSYGSGGMAPLWLYHFGV